MVRRNVSVGGNLVVAGTITSSSGAAPSFIGGITLTGNPQACIIFESANLNEKARLCSSVQPDDQGLYISVDEGVTQNFRVANAGNTIITPEAGSTTTALTVNGVAGTATVLLNGVAGQNALSINTGTVVVGTPTSGIGLTVTGNATAPAIFISGNGTTIAPALRLLNNPASLANDAFITIGNSGSIAQGLPGYLVTTTANFANYFPPYAPLASAMNGQVNYYGDSMTFGFGASSPTNRWTTVLSNYFGSTENNLGFSGNQVNDMVGSSGVGGIYATSRAGTPGTVFLAYGINDIDKNSPDNIFDELRRTTEAITLFCCLPDGQKVNARRNATQTGTWTSISQFGTWGVATSNNTSNYTISTTVTGRFVCFSLPVDGISPNNIVVWNISKRWQHH